MSDKKIIVTALILSVLLIGAGWYYSKYGVSPAAISNPKTTPTPEAKVSAGIPYGNPDAPVVIEEYSSFLCGACVNFHSQTFGQIENDYIKTGKVKFVFYSFPPYELGAAAFCAQAQGKYNDYSDYLYSHNQNIKAAQDLIDFAVNAGLNQETFKQCFDSKEAKDAAQNWTAEGEKRGVEATPTFFINGQKLVGAQPYADFQKIIDEQLNKAK